MGLFGQLTRLVAEELGFMAFFACLFSSGLKLYRVSFVINIDRVNEYLLESRKEWIL